EGCRACLFSAVGIGGDCLHVLAQNVEPRIFVRPWIHKRLSVKRVYHTANVFEFKDARSFGDQKADSELHGRAGFKEICVTQDDKQVQVSVHRSPRREGNERRMQGQPKFAESADHREEIGARVAFVEVVEDRIINGFDCADDEQTPCVAKARKMFVVFAQVFNFDGDVVSDAWKFAMEFVDQLERVTNAIEEVGIAEGNVSSARLNLLTDVGHHHVATHYAKDPFVDWNDRTVAAEMFATATRFGRANDAVSITWQNQMRILLERRHSRAIGDLEAQAFERDE